MFSLLFIKYLNLDNRTRRLAGISVVFVCAFFAGVIFLNASYFDRLNRYAGNDAYFYFHLNRSADSFYQIKIIEALLGNYHLDGLDRHLLGAELALVCQVRDQHDYCVLIMTAKKPKQLEAYLIANETPYKKLSRNDFAVAANPAYLASVKKNHNIFLRQRLQSALGKNGQLTAVIRQQKNLIGNTARLLSIAGPTNIKLYGHAGNGGIALSPSALPIISNGMNVAAKVPCDIFAAFSASSVNSAITGYLSAHYSGLSKVELPQDASANLCAIKKASEGNWLADYDYSLTIFAAPTDQLKMALQANINKVLAQADPKEKSIYMAGRDKVTLLYSNTAYSLASEASSSPIRLKSIDNALLISNTSNMPAASSSWPSLYIKTSALNIRPLNSLLNNFYQIEMNGDTIYIK